MEIMKLFPEVKVFQEACPMWVPLVENGEASRSGADYFVRKNVENLLEKSGEIDAVILACTHYPLLLDKITRYMPDDITIISQGPVVAASLKDYLLRHPEMDVRLSKGSQQIFLTTDSAELFDEHAIEFYGEPVKSQTIHL